MNHNTGKLIIVIGVAVVLIGILVYFFHDKLRWLGRLPGDIRIVRPGFSFFFPITTMIIISIVFSIIFQIIKRFL
ncbi:MAG: DUF2905 domain-containing protein [Bacteroidetes bacterium]|nr:MAG: DUF2905 domain-containing protein [Bacteroidota bacterium]